MRSDGPLTLQLMGISGLVALVLLTSLPLAWPNLVSSGPEPVQAQIEASAAQQATCVSQSERERIPSSFVQVPVLWLGPESALAHDVFFATLQLWLVETLARDEFLKAVAARGPPQV
jgi:hypothetical protein